MTEHIKMPDVDPVIRILADGVLTTFTYPFPIFASEDLQVSLNGALQSSGFTINGAGQTAGGSVTFDTAPADGTVITLARVLPLERVTDFIEGGDFSAESINTELDYLTASIQQVDGNYDRALRYSDTENPGGIDLPSKADRKNKALGFDGNGDPIAVSLAGSMASPDFIASGTGALTRTSTDKLRDFISVKDFGAVGDGLVNDTIAFQNALAAHDFVYVPIGTYLISATLTLTSGKTLMGGGQGSIIKCMNNTFNATQFTEKNAALLNLRIEGGDIGVKLFGASDECTQNTVSDVQIIAAGTGIQLDGYDDTNKPCYWNNFTNILVEQFTVNGVHLTLSSTGDTPNANRFHKVRCYSKGAVSSGSGFYVEHGSFNNSFVDCEANVNGASAHSCFRIGEGSNKTLIVNLLTESSNLVPNLRLENGSIETAIMNLSAESDGAAIEEEDLDLTEANRHAEEIAKLKAKEYETAFQEINKSLRSEIVSQDKYVRRMRPTFGYLMAATWAAQMMAIAYIIVFDTARAGLIMSAMSGLSAIWAVGLSVLGIYVYKRSEDKKIFGKETIFWND